MNEPEGFRPRFITAPEGRGCLRRSGLPKYLKRGEGGGVERDGLAPDKAARSAILERNRNGKKPLGIGR